MSAVANHVRGEAMLQLAGHEVLLRPSFNALVAAEQEIGPLFDLVERAAAGRLGLAELVALFWHCRVAGTCPFDREGFAHALADVGLLALTPVLKILLRQILQGR
ncbi:tail tube GTA-gp10-like protein [Blastomonas natatoria]|uniref:Tail tube GTA-gp10-like protein n=1 Tax=Blastomonas natatoria TaxID=34015 RepID=A0A2V3VNN1_9SPHN|nr:gene transfer agent family protein [Blastomonas natatoria]PXW78139.1 tail tube GTA-gp10-like protein [Blastomonas natatoria]